MENSTFNADATENVDIDVLSPVYDNEAPVVAPTPTRLEAAANEIVNYIAELTDGKATPAADKLRALADVLETEAARSISVRISTPTLLEVTGNVSESELAARHMEAKVRGALFHAKQKAGQADGLEWLSECFRAAAQEFRAGLHLPQVVVEGRVIPYNEDNDTGIKHADNLRAFFADAHARNVKAGWWTDLETGQPKKRSPGEMMLLMVTEIAEAYKAWRHHENDDKLPQYPGIGVEMGDLGIRWADFCGALAAGRIIIGDPADNPGDVIFQDIVRLAEGYELIRKTPAAIGEPETAPFLPPMDVAEMTDMKLSYNAHRADHKLENRLKDDGKKT